MLVSSSLSYLSRLHPAADKVKALQEVPSPRNVSELESYLEVLTYYAKFVPNTSTALSTMATERCQVTLPTVI